MIDLLLPPALTHIGKRRQHLHKTMEYNAAGQKLDIWRQQDLTEPAPVLLYIPGGAWVFGSRFGQGYALMSHLVELGWICVAIDYRTSPLHRWPTHFIDVKYALAWTRAHIEEYGGDATFIAVGGASAGGHLASLAGLAWDSPTFFTHPSERPDAVVTLYGVFDWEYRGSLFHDGFMRLVEAVVVRKRQSTHPDIYRNASPIAHVRADAPPFCIAQGAEDHLTPRGGARRFADKLSAVSKSAVVYYEIPGVGHGFDLTHGRQTAEAVEVIAGFLRGARQALPVAS